MLPKITKAMWHKSLEYVKPCGWWHVLSLMRNKLCSPTITVIYNCNVSVNVTLFQLNNLYPFPTNQIQHQHATSLDRYQGPNSTHAHICLALHFLVVPLALAACPFLPPPLVIVVERVQTATTNFSSAQYPADELRATL